MSQPTIDPCPRCGGECSIGTCELPGLNQPFCTKCALSGPAFRARQEAIEWWNNRQADRNRIEQEDRHRMFEATMRGEDQFGGSR